MWRVAVGAVLAYLLLVPLVLPVLGSPSPHDTARLLQVSLGGVCALAVWVGGRCLRLPVWMCAPQWRWVRRGLALAMLASVLSSARPLWAMREVALWCSLLAVAAVVCLAPAGMVKRWPLWAALAAGGYVAVLSVLGVAAAVAAQGIFPSCRIPGGWLQQFPVLQPCPNNADPRADRAVRVWVNAVHAPGGWRAGLFAVVLAVGDRGASHLAGVAGRDAGGVGMHAPGLPGACLCSMPHDRGRCRRRAGFRRDLVFFGTRGNGGPQCPRASG